MTDRDDDGQPADLDIESLEDEGMPAAERRRGRPRRADVVGAVASTLVRRVLDVIPGGWQALAQAGDAVVVEVPNATWVGPVADAWGRAVSSGDPQEHNGDGISRPSSWRPSSDSTWIGFRRDGIQKDHKPDIGNEAVAAGLAAGCVVVGFSPWPERHLPRALVRAADIRVATSTPDAAALDEALEVLTGRRPSSPLPMDLHRLIAVEDLRLAWRPGTDADGYLTRLRRLLDVKAKPPSLTLDHLHGMDEAVAWGRALTRDLDGYRRGTLPWSAVDRGVLLAGPSGTGKTTFAKALAGSCGVPLVVGSLSRWQSTGHLGDLLKAMRATFAEARAAAPAILFVDEIDAFGDRSGFTHENRDYSIQVVNGLLEELDGVEGREGVVVVGACNDPGRLDPAIVRSGRLDRTIPVPLPDREALTGILRHHLGTDLPDAELSTATLLARGATGADCERWVRGARRRARHGGRGMTIDDLTDEIRGMRRERAPEETYRYAVHEAGHALMIALEFPGTLTGVSIRETADTLGGTSAALDQRKPLTRSGRRSPAGAPGRAGGRGGGAGRRVDGCGRGRPKRLGEGDGLGRGGAASLRPGRRGRRAAVAGHPDAGHPCGDSGAAAGHGQPGFRAAGDRLRGGDGRDPPMPGAVGDACPPAGRARDRRRRGRRGRADGRRPAFRPASGRSRLICGTVSGHLRRRPARPVGPPARPHRHLRGPPHRFVGKGPCTVVPPTRGGGRTPFGLPPSRRG